MMSSGRWRWGMVDEIRRGSVAVNRYGVGEAGYAMSDGWRWWRLSFEASGVGVVGVVLDERQASGDWNETQYETI